MINAHVDICNFREMGRVVPRNAQYARVAQNARVVQNVQQFDEQRAIINL
jgi:hypothetical protein